tara:strand:+ start:7219 stop:7779 length:561 start_codon:yes stop_codon:yes gene_type:complete
MNFIEEYQLDPKLCDTYLSLMRQAASVGLTKPGISSNGLNRKVKASTDFFLGDADKLGAPFELWKSYHHELWTFVQDYITKYRFMEFGGTFQMKQLPVIQWYKPGEGFYKWHIDGAQSDCCDRAMVYMTYLNDVPDGGTMFYHQNYKTRAKKGNTVIFPAGYTHLHKGEISEKYHKYIITGWIWWE